MANGDSQQYVIKTDGGDFRIIADKGMPQEKVLTMAAATNPEFAKHYAQTQATAQMDKTIQPVEPSPVREAITKGLDVMGGKKLGEFEQRHPQALPSMQMAAGFAAGAPAAQDLAVSTMSELAAMGKETKASMPAGKAAAGFTKLKEVAGPLPVDTNMPAKVAMATDKLTEYGSQPVKVITDFLSRVTDPKAPPLTYTEARNFYSNATRLTDEELSTLKPVMRRQLAKFTQTLGKSIEQTVDSVNHLDTYRDAMKNYKLAMKLRSAGEYAKKAALGVAGASTAYELYRMARK